MTKYYGDVSPEIKQKIVEETQPLKEDNATLAFDLMVTDGEAKTARQEVADLNFQLMIGGVI
jgi:hypothetical protein